MLATSDETWLAGENVAEPAQRVVHPCSQGPDVDAQLAGHVPVGTVEHDGLQDGAAMVLADLRECRPASSSRIRTRSVATL